MRLFLHELRVQQVLFWRNREAAFFSFLFPIILLLVLGSVYSEPIEGVQASTYLLVGLIGYGIAATAFAGLAITLVVRRETGLLKRVRGTPLGPGTYLGAVIGSEVIVIALQVVAQLLVGRLLFDADWPRAPGSFAFAVALGAAALAALGIAVTALVRSAEGSSAVVNAIYLPMAFISGAFFSTQEMPAFLEAISEILPLTHLLDVIRSTFVAGEGLGASTGDIAGVAVWGLLGLVVAVRMFRWAPREGITSG
ncbi:MAG TPA: ABC transporter permease [Gaiellaceae bacterium]|nr:ABC transporter permease [Gaiellaceae bacterium]